NAQMAQKEAALDLAKTRLAYTRISSSQPGLIAERHVDGGTLLSTNTPIYTVVGIDTVFVEIGVTERDYPLIRKDLKAKLSVDALEGRTFSGEIARRAPLFQTTSRTAIVEVAIRNDSLLLKPGMFARVKITLQEKDSAQAVPSSAIVNRDQSTFVFMLDSTGSMVNMTSVKTGIVDGEFTEIISPVLKNQVVTVGTHLLNDGAKVIIAQNESIPEKGKTGKEQK
ncbi:MAG: efflux RND transporter periplasmic adaptor subunit, partial [Fibrobacter sp.]|nr:efflux RND transporter periplasmic adaptor subunit [Fibrobacter sp.]